MAAKRPQPKSKPLNKAQLTKLVQMQAERIQQLEGKIQEIYRFRNQFARSPAFLDQVGDMSPMTQAKVLRVLQNQTFERVGGNTPIKVDVRGVEGLSLAR